MSWDRDPLLAKAKLYFERAFSESHDDPLFGFWCSLGLELLARASIASVSPVLLAEPDKDHTNILYALKRPVGKTSPKSLGMASVLRLCTKLINDFTEDDFVAANALVNRRNDELHSGNSAFSEYASNQWLTGFYRICQKLTKSMGSDLKSVFGDEEAKAAELALKEKRDEVEGEVKGLIGKAKHAFEGLPKERQEELLAKAKEHADELVFDHHHRVKCPACNSDALVQGNTYGVTQVKMMEDAIEIKQPVSPKSFACTACGLKLEGYARLDVAGIGGHYTRTSKESPEEYYGLVDPDTFDFSAYLEDLGPDYDNE